MSEASAQQVDQKLALVPGLESRSTQVHIVNFDSLLDILRQTLNEVFSRLQLIKHSVNQIHTQDASSLLLEELVGSRKLICSEVCRSAVTSWLLLKAQTQPTVRFVPA